MIRKVFLSAPVVSLSGPKGDTLALSEPTWNILDKILSKSFHPRHLVKMLFHPRHLTSSFLFLSDPYRDAEVEEWAARKIQSSFKNYKREKSVRDPTLSCPPPPIIIIIITIIVVIIIIVINHHYHDNNNTYNPLQVRDATVS